MAQRCSYCGKTEKQHGGKACVDVAGLRRALRETVAFANMSVEAQARLQKKNYGESARKPSLSELDRDRT